MLLGCQGGQPGVLVGVPESVEDPVSQGRVQQRLSRTDAADVIEQVRAADLFQEVSGSTSHDGGEECLIVRIGGQHHAGHLWVPQRIFSTDLHATAVGEPDVEDRHIGPSGGDASKCLRHRTCLAHYDEVVCRFDQRAKPAADHRVIVEEEHTQAHRMHPFTDRGNARHVNASQHDESMAVTREGICFWAIAHELQLQ